MKEALLGGHKYIYKAPYDKNFNNNKITLMLNIHDVFFLSKLSSYEKSILLLIVQEKFLLV